MKSEKDFIHLISNQVATAKISIEMGLEGIRESASPDPGQEKLLETALQALNNITKAIYERRADSEKS